MKNFLMAAVAAVSLGMTGAAMASQPMMRHSVDQQARNDQVAPQQRPAYLASNGAQGNSSVLPSQRPAYLSWLPSQRPDYLA
ncbi:MULTISPECIES: hypothetical protein [unclassified Acidisoma]|jgi:hypothetical protein|uniref:hypothetical protein n=1 Tax=unclassified Acidisoma TaxID=2634065 RepID=UPI00131CA6E7|nr:MULTISPECIES: hypothetical protein [unclassified Acidisoma]